jgi:hypothetical protein
MKSLHKLSISTIFIITFSFSTTINIPDDYATIQAGIDAASDGDTVLVAAGTYVENINCSKSITIAGSGIDSTFVDGGGNNRVFDFSIGGTSLIIEDLTIQNGAGEREGGGFKIQTANNQINIIINRCHFLNNQTVDLGGNAGDMTGGGAIYIGAEGWVTTDTIYINDCIFSNNYAVPITDIEGETASGFGGAINLHAGIHLAINNSTFFGNIAGAEINSIFSLETVYLVVSNSILFDETPVLNGEVQVSFSNINGGWEGEGNIDANPLFCESDSGDFSLAENSPCVGTGENDVNMGAFGVGCGIINQVFHVATTGSDETGNGSETNPFATIQKGIDTSSDGDTVMVAAGTYVENIDYSSKQLVIASHFLGSDGDDDFISNTVIDGDSTASCVTMNAVGSELIGFTLTNGFSDYLGGAIYITGQYGDFTISHCLIINNFSAGDYDTPIVMGDARNTHYTFDHLTVFDNYNPVYGYINNGVVLSGAGGNENVITITNSIYGWFEHYGVDEPPVENYSNNYSSPDSPLFCNPENGDYSLAANSPCVGTGENGVNIGALGVGCEALILAPVLTDISDHQIEEDGDLIIDINATSDIGASMTFYAESDTSSVITFVEYAALILTPEPDWNGSSLITVIVTDENELSDTTDFTLTVNAVNDSPEDFSVLYPTVLDTFSTHVDSDTAIVFNWEESYDVDSDVTYTLTIELEFFGNTYTDVHENISDTTISISSNSLDALLNVTSQDIATITYVVSSSDGEYMVASDVGEFVLFRAALGVNGGLSVPDVYALHQNYPNPFNPVTTLQYDLPEDAMVNITIYDMMGRVVSNLVSTQQNAGYKSIQWNATNNQGQPVSAGLYLYTIQAGEFRQTKKMVLLK